MSFKYIKNILKFRNKKTMTSTYYKNRSIALAHFTEEEKAVIERYNALLQQIGRAARTQRCVALNKVYDHLMY